MAVVAPWLQIQPSEFTSAAEHGLALGQQVVAQRSQAAQAAAALEQRRQAEQQQMQLAAQHLAQQQMEFSAQHATAQEALQNQFQVNQQKNDIAKAYHDQTASIQQGKLDAAGKAAADKYAAVQKYAALIASGTPADKAILQVPQLMSPGVNDSLVGASLKNSQPGQLTPLESKQYDRAKAESIQAQRELANNPLGDSAAAMQRIKSASATMKAIEDAQTKKATPQGVGANLIFDKATGKIKEAGAAQVPEVVPPANRMFGGSETETLFGSPYDVPAQ